MVTAVARIHYHQYQVGAVSYDAARGVAFFEYEPSFIATGIELAPLTMPLSPQIYQFSALNWETFKGLPGMLADSLPDDFGNAVLNAWAARQGRNPNSISPLERLLYTGARGMGALEYAPAHRLRRLNASQKIALDDLLSSAQAVLDNRQHFQQALASHARDDQQAMLALLSVGTSAGGARPKAVLAFNDDFTQVRSGQVAVPAGFTHYLMKFDGVTEHQGSRETYGDPQGFGVMEYVYHLMASTCGINMMPCHLLHEGRRRHFLTQRFDRQDNNKVHIQTLTAMAHVDFKKPGSFSYEELFSVARRLKLPAGDAEQLAKRMLFNLVARNHDDHAKNVAFMLKEGRWRLAPAYDLAYSYKPDSPWVDQHWMSLNGKRKDFKRADIHVLEKMSPLFGVNRLDQWLDEVCEAVSQWPELAKQWQVPKPLADLVNRNLCLQW